MYTNEFYYSRTETTYETPRKTRKIPVNQEAKTPAGKPTSATPEKPSAPPQEPVQESKPEPQATAPKVSVPEASQRETLLAEENVRVNAEFANYRKRVERDKETVKAQALETTLERLFPVLDDISFARRFGDLQEGPFAAIAVKLETTLSGMGLVRIDEVGVEFDPAIHEALIRQPNDEIPEDHVSQILRDGWRSENRVLRAAQVAVSAG
jgi:molecular chaperone GrpE